MATYTFRPSLTIAEMYDIAKELGVRTTSKAGHSHPTPRVFGALIRKLQSLARELASRDLEATIVESMLRLFQPVSDEPGLLHGGDMLILNLDHLWNALIGSKPPLRLRSGERVDEDALVQMIPNSYAAVRTFIIREQLEVSLAVGGRAARTLSQMRDEAIQAYKRKIVAIREAPVRSSEEEEASSEMDSEDQVTPVQAPVIRKLHGAYGRVEILDHTDGLIARKVAKESSATERLLAEIGVVNAIMEAGGHPNICQYLRTYRDPPCIEMRAYGAKLLDVMNVAFIKGILDGDVLPGLGIVWRPFTLMLDCARALQFLHVRLEYIHTDFKDNNVVIDENGRAKLIDFDAAQHPLTDADRVAGKRLRTTISACTDRKLAVRDGDFGFDVDVFQWGMMANQILKDYVDGNHLLQALCNECVGEYNKRPTATRIVERMEEAISLERETTGRRIESALPEGDYGEPRTYAMPRTSATRCLAQLGSAEQYATRLFNNESDSNFAYSVRIATLNCRMLGLKSPQRLQSVASLIIRNSADIVAMQEVQVSSAEVSAPCAITTALQEALLQLDPEGAWQVRVSNPLSDGGREHSAFAYRGVKVSCMSEQCLQPHLVQAWPRAPYAAKFRVGATRLLLCSVHLSPKAAKAESDVEALPLLTKWLKEHAGHRRNRILLLGDFNLESSAKAFQPLLECGWLPTLPSLAKTNSVGKSQWDNIWVENISEEGMEQPIRSGVSAESVKGFWRTRRSSRCMGEEADTSEKGVASDHCAVFLDHEYMIGTNDDPTASLPHE